MADSQDPSRRPAARISMPMSNNGVLALLERLRLQYPALLNTLMRSKRYLDYFLNFVREHGTEIIQILGVAALITAIVIPPVLGAIGFSAAGPVLGSAAAAWQAQIGLVGAGSLFAWCQSVAMGGAALGGLTAIGALGAAAAVIPEVVARTGGILSGVGDWVGQKTGSLWSR